LDRKKLRKRAVQSLKSSARVNLCACSFARPGWRFRRPRTSAASRPGKSSRRFRAVNRGPSPLLPSEANQAGLRSNLGDLLKGSGSSAGLGARAPTCRRAR
jgi:hypothetical protein